MGRKTRRFPRALAWMGGEARCRATEPKEEGELREVLLDYLRTPNSLQYDVSAASKVDGAKLQKNELLRHQVLLKRIYQIKPSLSFTPICMKASLSYVAVQQKEAWKFTMHDMDAFSSDVGVRLRTMLRHCSQNLRKKNPPKWCSNIFKEKVKQMIPASTLVEDSPEPKEPKEPILELLGCKKVVPQALV